MPTPDASPRPRPGPTLRVDEIALCIQRPLPHGVAMELRPPRIVTAAHEHVLPVYEGWYGGGELRVTLRGVCDAPFSARLAMGGALLTTPAFRAEVGEEGAFTLELVANLRALGQHLGASLALGVWVSTVLEPGPSDAANGRVVPLAMLFLAPITGPGPSLASVDVLEVSDTLLFGAPERRMFDLQNPEEGFWSGTGRWCLRLVADWMPQVTQNYALDVRPSAVTQEARSAAEGVFVEDAARRAGSGSRTSTEFTLDTSHAALATIPDEGMDVALDVRVDHTLTFQVHTSSLTATLAWTATLPVRVRDPRPLFKSFQRLSAVGVDFGTASTVAALVNKGYRSLLRLGSSATEAAKSAENPTVLLVEDHEALWAEMNRVAAVEDGRFPNLLRLVRGSHAAFEAMGEVPSAVVGELKSLPERVIRLDQSPQLRDREKQRDFLLDETRVRLLVRTYAYLLGRAINRPGQDVYLHYWLTHPAKFDAQATRLLEEEIKAGLLLSIPRAVSAESVSVSMSASEPEAFAAEVCPELAAHPALEPLITKFGELRFCVFDFGGGSLDVACGRFRPATEEEQRDAGSATVIETLQVGGDDHLGGDYLTHELAWLTHQDELHLPEMEEKEVPMMRPVTVPPNDLVRKPHLYKRSLAGRQNRVRFDRELGLEQVKWGPEHAPKRRDEVPAARLDGTEVVLTSLGADVPAFHERLEAHLSSRIRDGVKLMKNMLRIAQWGGESKGDWREQGVVILLAGNSSRSGFVEKALAEELGLEGLRVWRPGSDAPFEQVVLYEAPGRVERGVTIVGVTPKTAVALGALKIASQEVQLVRRTQGFSYFLGDLRGFPPKFQALVPMGTPIGDASGEGPHVVEIGRWDSKMPLRVCKDYVPGKMTSSDPRIVLVPSGLQPGSVGKLFVAVTGPDEVALRLEREGQEPLVSKVSLGPYLR